MVEPTNTTVTFTVDAEVYRRVEAAQVAERAAQDQCLETHEAKAGRARLAEVTRAVAQARRELAVAYSDLAGELGGARPLTLPLIRRALDLRSDAEHSDEFADDLERAEVDS